MKRVLLMGCLLLVQFGTADAQIKASTERQLSLNRIRGAWFTTNGGRFHAGDPAKPAVLLIHGLHQSANSFLKPSELPQGSRWYFNYASKPADVRAVKDAPNVGIFKVGTSERLEVDAQNWFDFLKAQGYTVATWSQPGLSFADAYPSAAQAYDQFLAETAALNPASPPPVVLIGHSRGGLIARQLLKDKGSQNRVTTMISLHSPHRGSTLADRTESICEGLVGMFSSAGEELKKQLLRAAGLDKEFRSFCETLNTFVVTDGESRELSPNGPLIQGLAQGEVPLPGVKYYTFGGTSPTFVRYYAWVLKASSALPQTRIDNGVPRVYYVWEAVPQEIQVLSPLFDKGGFIAPELQDGRGDGLVSNLSARLPFGTHYVNRLNHAEVLWDRGLQQQVLGLIKPVSGPLRLPTSIRK